MGAVIERKGTKLPVELQTLKDSNQVIDDLELLMARHARVGDTDKAAEAASEYVKRIEEVVTLYKQLVRPRGRQPSKSPSAETLRSAAGNTLKVSALGLFTAAEIEGKSGIRKQKISKWDHQLGDKPGFIRDIVDSASRKWLGKRGQSDQRGASGTGENEWYTPLGYLEMAREVLGEFDLDPASSPQAQKRVRAARYFTPKQDGLKQEWHGRVWLNPPYAQPFIAQFSSKLLAEYEAGRTTAAIMLTHNYTDTTWFQSSGGKAAAICFKKGRIQFERQDGKIAQPTQGQAFFYFGEDVALFKKVFSRKDWLVVRRA